MILTWGRTAALLVVAGTFAFGAVYPWAYWPILMVAFASGAPAVASADARRGADRWPRSLASMCAAVLAAILLQLVPLPRTVVVAISPATDAFLSHYELGYTARAFHALSIAPSLTLLGAAFWAAMAVYFTGMTARLDREDVVAVARALTGAGAAISLVAIAQNATSADRIYGLWMPYSGAGQIFGPFVNHNHFAGWIIMAWPLGAGHLCSRILRSVESSRGGWRRSVEWISTPLFAEVALTSLALLIMAAALLRSGSRSGIACGGFAVVVFAALADRRRIGAAARPVALATVVLIACAGVLWIGPDLVKNRFAGGSWFTGAGRFAPWRDALSVARAFPVAGTGLNTYRVAMLSYQTANPAILFDAAHNDYLQLAAEGGLLVGLPALALLGACLNRVRDRLRARDEDPSAYWRRVGAVAGLAGIAAQSTVDFSLQIPANALLCATLSAIALRPAIITRPRRP